MERQMRILITGAKGFVGKNLIATLENIQSGKDQTHGFQKDLVIYPYDIDSEPAKLATYCQDCDFVFHLAGVNRPKDESEFMEGNYGFTSTLLEELKRAHNACPIMLSSSIQAELDNPYGRSKAAGENLLRKYGEETGAKVYIYRFPNIFGKWCKPNYNSAIATFCHNVARGLPIQINDPAARLRLIYIDDVVRELIHALNGKAHMQDGFGTVHEEYATTVGEAAAIIQDFPRQRERCELPYVKEPLIQKLYATYLSYLSQDECSYYLNTHTDARGSFSEIFRTPERGQISVNVSSPGVVKGNHWHHTKNEKFLVVSGTGIIRLRNVHGTDVQEYYVSGDKLEVVDIPPGYTHNIENLGIEDMVTIMWASECFEPLRPDTYALEV